jgi:hypothetical protein
MRQTVSKYEGFEVRLVLLKSRRNFHEQPKSNKILPGEELVCEYRYNDFQEFLDNRTTFIQ